jgi:hypothetical protein
MMHRRSGFFMSLLIYLLLLPAANGQQTTASPAASVFTQLGAAKKVFLSNAGLDAGSVIAIAKFGKSDLPYEQFYRATQSWGRYAITESPSDSELVFEFRVDSALQTTGQFTTYSTFLNLTIFDTKTHFAIWAIKTPLGVNKQFKKSVDDSVNHLVDALKGLGALPDVSISPSH